MVIRQLCSYNYSVNLSISRFHFLQRHKYTTILNQRGRRVGCVAMTSLAKVFSSFLNQVTREQKLPVCVGCLMIWIRVLLQSTQSTLEILQTHKALRWNVLRVRRFHPCMNGVDQLWCRILNIAGISKSSATVTIPPRLLPLMGIPPLHTKQISTCSVPLYSLLKGVSV